MLLADPPDRNDSTRGEYNGRAEYLFCYEDTLGMVAQRAMPEVRDDHL